MTISHAALVDKNCLPKKNIINITDRVIKTSGGAAQVLQACNKDIFFCCWLLYILPDPVLVSASAPDADFGVDSDDDSSESDYHNSEHCDEDAMDDGVFTKATTVELIQCLDFKPDNIICTPIILELFS